MRISPVFISAYRKQNTKSENHTTSPFLSYEKDTVSFKSADYIGEGLKEVDRVIKKDIAPFMRDSKDLYLNVAKIGMAAQESLKSVRKGEMELFNLKSDLLQDSQNPLYPKVKKYLEKAESYETNVKNYDRLLERSKSEMYNTPEIKEGVQELKSLIYKPNRDLNALKRFKSAYEDSNEDLNSLLQNISLKNMNPIIFKRVQNLNNRFITAGYYMLITPYNDSVKLLAERNALEQDSKKTSRNIFDLIKRSEKLQENAQRISESTKLYYGNKQKIAKFASRVKYFETVIPEPKELEKEYLKYMDTCKDIAKNRNAKLEKDYLDNFAPVLSEIDFDSVDELLNSQDKKAQEIQSMIYKIKQELINKNNEDFMKSYGMYRED